MAKAMMRLSLACYADRNKLFASLQIFVHRAAHETWRRRPTRRPPVLRMFGACFGDGPTALITAWPPHVRLPPVDKSLLLADTDAGLAFCG
jgi:hypothetical protein